MTWTTARVTIRTIVWRGQWLASAAVVALLLAPSLAIALQFRTTLNCETTSVRDSSLPVSDSLSCGLPAFGSFTAQAQASFGGVSAETTASTLRSDAAGSASSNAFANDIVVFSNPDPNALAQFPLSLNLAFAGVLNAQAPAGFAAATASFSVGLVGLQEVAGFASFETSRGFQLNPSGFTGTDAIVPGAAGFSGVLTTPSVQAGLGPVELGLGLASVNTSSSGPGGLGRSAFALEFPTGIPVFNLPPGYTANAGDYLVDNRLVENGVVIIPEPATLLLLGGGVIGLMITRRLR